MLEKNDSRVEIRFVAKPKKTMAESLGSSVQAVHTLSSTGCLMFHFATTFEATAAEKSSKEVCMHMDLTSSVNRLFHHSKLGGLVKASVTNSNQ